MSQPFQACPRRCRVDPQIRTHMPATDATLSIPVRPAMFWQLPTRFCPSVTCRVCLVGRIFLGICDDMSFFPRIQTATQSPHKRSATSNTRPIHLNTRFQQRHHAPGPAFLRIWLAHIQFLADICTAMTNSPAIQCRQLPTSWRNRQYNNGVSIICITYADKQI